LCDKAESSATVYRAKLTTVVLTTPALAAIIESIVAQGVLIDNTTMRLAINKTCPVAIRSFSDPVCDPTHEPVVTTEESDSKKNGIVIAFASIGAFIALVALIIVLVLLLLLYRRHKRRYMLIIVVSVRTCNHYV